MKTLKSLSLALFLSISCFGHSAAVKTAGPDADISSKGFANPKLREDDPDIGTFVKIAKAAELLNLFEGTGPFTAFIPSNDAFKHAGDKQMDEWLKPENRDNLTVLILYHVVPGRYTEKNLKTKELGALNGKKLNITVSDNGNISVNDAKVVKKNISGPNGEIYVIDKVLTPKP